MQDIIYSLVKTYQNYDSECYNHWADTKIVSYHKTKEGADKELGLLVIEEYKSYDPSNCDVLLLAIRRQQTIDNKIEVCVGTHDDTHIYPLFEVKEIILKP